MLVYSKFPKACVKVLGPDLKLAKFGRRDKGISSILLSTSDQSLAKFIPFTFKYLCKSESYFLAQVQCTDGCPVPSTLCKELAACRNLRI